MSMGVGLLLIAIGAILRWGITIVVEGANLSTIGLILMLVGAAGIVLGLLTGERSPRWRPRRRDDRGGGEWDRTREHERL